MTRIPPLRKCQQDAVDTLTEHLEECLEETNLNICTGAGKTRILLEYITNVPDE